MPGLINNYDGAGAVAAAIHNHNRRAAETLRCLLLGGCRGVASDKRQRRVCGYPQRVMRPVSPSLLILRSVCAIYTRDADGSHNLLYRIRSTRKPPGHFSLVTGAPGKNNRTQNAVSPLSKAPRADATGSRRGKREILSGYPFRHRVIIITNEGYNFAGK